MSTGFAGAGPYVGLVPFSEDHADFFFGRDQERTIVTANLKAARLTLLYGPSGVGKSSLLLAGVVPDLRATVRRNVEAVRRSDERAPLAVAVFRGWRDDPVPALAGTIRAAAEDALAGTSLQAPSDGMSLLETLRLWTTQVRTILVVLDQFEDYFLYHGREDGDGTFAVEFPRVVNAPGLRVNFLLSIREDTLAKLDRFKGSIPGLFGNYLRVEHLGRDAARAAIEKPIAQYALLARNDGAPSAVEPELVEAILSDVETGKVVVGQAGAGVVRDLEHDDGAGARIEAPYLQLVLARLWSEEVAARSGTLRLETLQRLGGAEQIVRTHLDQALSALPFEDQEIASRLFHYLVTPSGTKIAHTAEDLAGYAAAPEAEAAAVLESLAGESRILRPVGNSSYEIYHDVLAPAILEWRNRFEARRDEQERARRRLRRRLIFLAACLAATTLALVGRSFNIQPLERSTVDTRFAIRGADAAPSNVVAVAIDDLTFSELKKSWPFPRSLHAKVIDRLREAGARVIVYDVQFTEATDAADDNALITSVGRAAGRIVLATTEVGAGGHTTVLGGDATLREVGARAGNALLPLDAGGVNRRLPYQTDGLKSLSVVAAEVAFHRRITRANLGGHNSTWIDYIGPPGHVRTLSFSRVLQGRFDPSAVRGKVVVVGPSAPSLQDVHSTPFGSSDLMSGAEIQANAVSTALRNFPLQNAAEVLSIALIAFLGLVVPLVSLRLSTNRTLAVGIAVGVAYVAAIQLAFNGGLVLPVVYPLGLLVVAVVASLGLDAGT